MNVSLAAYLLFVSSLIVSSAPSGSTSHFFTFISKRVPRMLIRSVTEGKKHEGGKKAKFSLNFENRAQNIFVSVKSKPEMQQLSK